MLYLLHSIFYLFIFSLNRLCSDAAGYIIRVRRPLTCSHRDWRGVQLGRRGLWETWPRQQWKTKTTQTDRGSAGRGSCAGIKKKKKKFPKTQWHNQLSFKHLFFFLVQSWRVASNTRPSSQRMENSSLSAVEIQDVWARDPLPTRWSRRESQHWTDTTLDRCSCPLWWSVHTPPNKMFEIRPFILMCLTHL